MSDSTTPTRPPVVLTTDHSWGFYEGLDQIQKRHHWPHGAISMLMVMQSESNGMRANAHNPRGDASGLIQFMPETLRLLGFPGTHADLRALSAEEQLPWVERYFASRPNMPADPDATAFYVATFLPAFLPHADDPDFVLARAPERNYEANKGFDHEGNGVIRVRDLAAALMRNAQGARWREAASRLAFVEGGGATWSFGMIAKVVGGGAVIGGLAFAAYHLAMGGGLSDLVPTALR